MIRLDETNTTQATIIYSVSDKFPNDTDATDDYACDWVLWRMIENNNNRLRNCYKIVLTK